MSGTMTLKRICADLRGKKLNTQGQPRVQLASLFLFFNTFLKKKAINDAQLNDRIIQRFFTDYSANQHAKLRQLFHEFVSNDRVIQIVQQGLISYGASPQQSDIIINPLYISFLRILCIPRIHVIDTALFRDTISKILIERGNLRADIVSSLLNLDVLEIYKEAFTHMCVSYEKNYEVWETLGDRAAKGLLAFYSVRRFPDLLTSPGSSEILTGIGQRYESKAFFHKLFDYRGCERISAYKEDLVYINPSQAEDKVYGDFVLVQLDKSMKEDIFEAFLGVTQYLIDSKIQLGMGNAICYNIFSSLYDEQDIEPDITTTASLISVLNELFNASPRMYDHSTQLLDTYNFYDKAIEKGTGLQTGMVRMKLKLTFRPDPQGKRRNIVKAFEIKQLIEEILWSDWSATSSEAKENVAGKALKLLEEKYKLIWKRGRSELSNRLDLLDDDSF